MTRCVTVSGVTTSPWFGGGPHSDGRHAIERYNVSDDGAWLNLALELDDPETFTTPLLVTKRWRRAPDVRIRPHVCDVLAAQLEGVFAEYLDPAKIDSARALRAAGRTHSPPIDSQSSGVRDKVVD